ncbi:hypothetical protein [Bacillus sp. Marseille-Q1617]|uniref:hypothetical protein n=1 Tax=Bacillus sp. Marseille-Q1617 TaxID=2736887 RepID=UPI00158DB9C7|nr:hypothetical protein [Bacillus sp. Marseille-Q1617]
MGKQSVITIRMDLCELKLKVLNIALYLEEDDKYSREDAVTDLFRVVKQIEAIEELKSLNKATN